MFNTFYSHREIDIYYHIDEILDIFARTKNIRLLEFVM